ncbi:MAG: hypothetical protein KA297_22515 [Kofleriaceae bacterium]|nr:hypothetical protein [Kofleriaceae bacterium]
MVCRSFLRRSGALAALVVAAVLAPARPAAALTPWHHRQVTLAACSDAGLPNGFCLRAGQAAHDTDLHEWDVPAAHAQRAVGQGRCAAATAAVDRTAQLSARLVAVARAGDGDGAAVVLGRLLHTVQDECAHHGMTNPQHAHLSILDVCTGGEHSPDETPEAAACASTRTAEVMALAAAALAEAPAGPLRDVCIDGEGGATCERVTLPSPLQACDFLGEHDAWDGADTRWDGAVVGPALVRATAAGLRAQAPSWRCDDDAALAPPGTSPPASVPAEAEVCRRLELACLGKVDEAGAGPGQDEISAGCRAGNGGGPGAAWMLGLVLAGRAARRRRRRRPAP